MAAVNPFCQNSDIRGQKVSAEMAIDAKEEVFSVTSGGSRILDQGVKFL